MEFDLRASVRRSTINPSILDTGITLRPCIVLKLRLVLTPSTPSSLFTLFVTNVVSLVSSKSAYVLISLLELSLWYRTTGTIQQMMMFDEPTELWVMLVAFECAGSAVWFGCKGWGGLRDDSALGGVCSLRIFDFGVAPCSKVL